MSKDQQQAFREPDDLALDPPDSAANRLAGRLPIFPPLLIIPAIAPVVSGAML